MYCEIYCHCEILCIYMYASNRWTNTFFSNWEYGKFYIFYNHVFCICLLYSAAKSVGLKIDDINFDLRTQVIEKLTILLIKSQFCCKQQHSIILSWLLVWCHVDTQMNNSWREPNYALKLVWVHTTHNILKSTTTHHHKLFVSTNVFLSLTHKKSSDKPLHLPNSFRSKNIGK